VAGFKTAQFAHQAEDFERSKDLLFWAWFWEMGTGKAKQMIDTAVHLHTAGKIQSLVVVAPNGVHANFVGECKIHMAAEYTAHTYHSSRAHTKAHRKSLEHVVEGECKGMRVLAISYDAICTDAGFKAAAKLLTKFPGMVVLDESTAIKTPSAQRSKRAKALGKLAQYRRIADGTPLAEGPFDIYSQLQFLHQDYWKQHGLSSFFVFKAMFGKFVTRKAAGGGHQYQHLIDYANLDYLGKLISDVSTRYLKEDCLDLPPKLYKKLTFSLTPAQRDIYDQLRDNIRVELNTEVKMEAAQAIVRLMRLQQIASGYAVGEEKVNIPEFERPPANAEEALLRAEAALERGKRVEMELMPPESNPRLQLLLSYLETCHHKAIIWARFTKDIDLITHALGDRCLRYDGSTSTKDREQALERFRDPAGPQFICINLAALSRGVTLVVAKTVIYYTNSFHLIQRLQSEDRAHRIGQDEKVQYVDIVAEDTVDEHIVSTLREKFDLAASITGDRLREWIQ
jgi:SNF2 family DNA or RNA helicase